jgi:putative peptide modification system cyclase
VSIIDASTAATPDLARPAPCIRAVLVCDLADSTALIERVGDRAAADLMRRHDRMARDLMQRHGGREIDKTDGFLVLFERPVQAVGFALGYQRGLRELGEELQQPLRARIGLHVGEVVLWDNAPADIADGAKPVEVEGLAKPVAARLMSLALPGQILLSETARTLAQRAHAELPDHERVRWLTHGRYRFKGVPAPLTVHEVGESGVAVLAPPPSSSKAQRERPWWRQPAALVAEALLLAAAVGVALYFTLRSPSAIAFGERDWVVLADVGNLTSQPLLTDSLDVALRIGLEQSRYVNVVPTTSVRETLKRMRRPPDSPIDRAAGVEIAQREGARALILPTVAEVGGRVRVTAEVIDPASGDTVYSDAAGGEGLDSVLGSTDELLGRLRERLGESIASIQRDNQPLAQITTDSLDALKAFALGEAALGEGRLKDAMALLGEAVTIDPDFAMAHARLSTLHHALGDDASAHLAARQALSRQQHLSTRERLLLEGVGSFYSAPSQAREKWNTLLSLYPDTPVAQNNIGLATLWFDNDPAGAAPHFREFARGSSPLRGYGWLGLGLCLTMQEDFAGARQAFAEAERLGVMAPSFEDVLLPIAQRDYARAQVRLDGAAPSLPPAYALERQLRKAAIALDSGHYAAAAALLQGARDDLPKEFPQASRQRALLQEATLLSHLRADAARTTLAAHVAVERARLAAAAENFDRSPLLHLGLAALLAQRHGDGVQAHALLAEIRPLATEAASPSAARLWRSAACEIESTAPDARVACLQTLYDGKELVQSHYAALLALRQAGRSEEALREADWLLAHRGRALGELQKLDLQFLNLLALNDALLTRAELLQALGRGEDAKQAMATLRAAWPDGIDYAPAAKRLEALDAALLGQQDDQPQVVADLVIDRLAARL